MADRDWAVIHQNRISGRNTTANPVPPDAFKVQPETTFDALADRLTQDGLPRASKGRGSLPMSDQAIDDEGV